MQLLLTIALTTTLSEVEYLVKFRGWSARWNEWINESSNRLFKIPENIADER